MAKLRQLRVPFGEMSGRLYAPDEVANGLACECRCPCCEARLVANHPKDRIRRRAYFAHYHAEECSGGFESALHKMAIQIVYEAGWLKVPGKNYHGKAHIAGNYYESWTISLPEQQLTFEQVVYEKTTNDRLRPDLTATLNDGTIVYVEIFVTHEVEDQKAQALDNVLEIDLSNVSRDQVEDIEALKRIVLQSAPRKWYRSSWLDKQLQNSPDKHALDEKHDRDRKTYFRQLEAAKSERRKREEFLKALEKKRQAEREPFLGDLEKAMRLSEPGKADLLRQNLKKKCEPDIAKTQHLMESLIFTQTGSPVHGSELETEGDWIVKTHPLIWKAYVMKEFIFMARLGSSFSAGRVVNEVQKWFGYWPWMQRLTELKRLDMQRRQSTQPRILSDEEFAAIKLPETVMAAFLDRLSGRPYGYLEKLKGGHQYIVRYQNPFSLQADHFTQKFKARNN